MLLKTPRSRLGLSLALLALLPGSSVRAASLADTVKEAIASHPDVLIAGSERAAVEQQLEQARAGYLPQVDFTVGTGWESTDNSTTRAAGEDSRELSRQEAEIRIRQLLFDGFATRSEVERQRARVNSQAYETFTTAEALGLRAVEAYLDVVRKEQLVRLATENLDSHQETYDRIVTRGERGVSSQADVQQSLGRLSLARTSLMTEQNRLQDARAVFRSIVGHDPADLEETAAPVHLLPATRDEAVEFALASHPRLMSAEAEIEAARRQHTAVKGLFYPKINLDIKGSNNRNVDGLQGSSNDAEVMVRGQYSLTGGRDTARRRESAIQVQQAREAHDRTRRQVTEAVQLSWNAYETATIQLEQLKAHVDASEQALQAYHRQFSIGQRTLLDLLDQENEVFQAKINYTDGLHDLTFSSYRVLAGTGKLLWAFDINPPEQASPMP